ncbi:acetyltransferase [Basidiobolus meristosporus CBS 931.73]|uniref:Glucosamine 6-phosphate N-acetyltransferase n=1 Tax=Basidiobolus meristosporus CBS 931.73 TaxID=1314790 RepID=A0A1Y1YN23_9FUNG|nr:acetyltransferase [Basidiobolus meristosporus CBS 931.73]|eukprot:ORX99430.1 acetyltransferase [Basidiobolus meristosporus CBS 931.73]
MPIHSANSEVTLVPVSKNSKYLFSYDLLSSEIQATLPNGLLMRPLAATDYNKGFFECLAQLTSVGETSEATFVETFEAMRNTKNYYVVVIEDQESGRIVGCGTLLVEYKFIRGCAKSSHIEDIVIDDSQRGKRLGVRMIEQLKALSEKLGCYKVILNTNQSNIAFYEKCGLTLKDYQMSCYHHA